MSDFDAAGIRQIPTFTHGSDPSRRMVGAILQTVAQLFDESGCPLTAEQRSIIGAALAELERAA